MKQVDTLEELAKQCGIDVTALSSTVERFNSFCHNGVDADFARGGKAHDRSIGDPTVKPNPSLGAIEKPPFCAVAICPGNNSTFGGLVADEHARVLANDGKVIDGLYVTGTSAGSVAGRSFPGAGASIGPALTFGYITAHHVAAS